MQKNHHQSSSNSNPSHPLRSVQAGKGSSRIDRRVWDGHALTCLFVATPKWGNISPHLYLWKATGSKTSKSNRQTVIHDLISAAAAAASAWWCSSEMSQREGLKRKLPLLKLPWRFEVFLDLHTKRNFWYCLLTFIKMNPEQKKLALNFKQALRGKNKSLAKVNKCNIGPNINK